MIDKDVATLRQRQEVITRRQHKVPKRIASVFVGLTLLSIQKVQAQTSDSLSSTLIPGTTIEEVIVTAPDTRRGAARGGLPATGELTTEDIQRYGADTLTELIAALKVQTQSSKSESKPLVLVNGRVASESVLATFPPEAAAKLEILPEETALRYGIPADRRVVNIILKPHFSALTSEVINGADTEGGGGRITAHAALVNSEMDTQSSVQLNYAGLSEVRESQRGIVSPNSNYRSLQPKVTTISITGTTSRPIGGVNVSSTFTATHSSSQAQEGLINTTLYSLSQNSQTKTFSFNTSLNGLVGRFTWTGNVAYSFLGVRSSTVAGLDNVGGPQIRLTASSLNTITASSVFSGTIFRLPAGPLFGAITLLSQIQRLSTRSSLATSGTTSSPTVSHGEINITLPLTNRNLNVIPVLGDTIINLGTSLQQDSNHSLPIGYSYGLSWKPSDWFQLTLSAQDQKAAPDINQLRAPIILTPNVLTFDYSRGQPAYVTQLSGGGRNLSASETRNLDIQASVEPVASHALRLIADYKRTQTSNAISSLPPITSAVEAAFPGNFVRNAAGVLTEIDMRPVNLALKSTETLDWGFQLQFLLSKHVLSHEPSAANTIFSLQGEPQFELSMQDTWYLGDSILIREGQPQLDLLKGAPADGSGGQSQHTVTMNCGITDRGLGLQVDAVWKGGTVVRGGALSSPGTLSFSSLITGNLRLFSNLDRTPGTGERAWAKGARLSLTVINFLDAHERIRDASGNTPINFQAGYIDPHGRVIELSFRKLF